ncbi:hypothetical protein SAMN05216390_102352 [Lachnospiraceae bacterium KH1T2]|nr:hypothetical protein SAMN05216390_102352 [Lachnospiraceae bacterium KH1T2]
MSHHHRNHHHNKNDLATILKNIKKGVYKDARDIPDVALKYLKRHPELLIEFGIKIIGL